MNHMKTASIRELRYDFGRIERLLQQGQEIEITKRRRVIARLSPETTDAAAMPDFLKRLRANYGGKKLPLAGAELVAEDRSRY